MSAPPLVCQWDGDVFRPRHPRIADRDFVVGQTYALVEQHARSQASHSHFFAALEEAWSNLPEREAERFPTAEALRKFCLIRAGYADSRSIVAASKAEALRVAAFVKPMDAFAVVTVKNAVITVFTAQSQSLKAMGRQIFGDSKQKVLEIAAELVGVTPDVLARQREAA